MLEKSNSRTADRGLESGAARTQASLHLSRTAPAQCGACLTSDEMVLNARGQFRLAPGLHEDDVIVSRAMEILNP
jgi:hypothetical protein